MQFNSIKKVYVAFLVGLFLAVAGYAARLKPIDKMTVAELTESTLIKRDDFKKFTTADSMSVRYIDIRGAWDMSDYWLLATLKDGDAAPEYVVVVQTIRPGKKDWALWRQVLDKNGMEFPVASIEKKAMPQKNGDIVLREIIHIGVTRDYLEKAQIDPIPWKMYGESAEESFTMRTNLIAGFLLKCDKELLPLAKPKTPTRKPISSDGL